MGFCIHWMPFSRSQTDVQKIVDRETKSFQSKVTELQILVDKLRKQVKAARDSEKVALGEAGKAREEVEKKAALVLRLREERTGRGSRQSRGAEDEREELKGQVHALEERLRVMNTAEKPYEDEKESKIIKNAEEVARWDERKKWQKKMEEAKQRLREADLEVSKLSKQNTSLRETIQRLEREKMVQEARWKSHLKVGWWSAITNGQRMRSHNNTLQVGAVKDTMHDGRQELLHIENSQLKEEVTIFITLVTKAMAKDLQLTAAC